MKKNYAHSLVDLLRPCCLVPAALDTHLSGISIDSRKVEQGDLFIAVAASEEQISAHISEAVKRGANAILREGSPNCKAHEDGDAVEVCLQNLRDYIGDVVSRFYLEPSKDLLVIGVTGTNGKTSVANYLASYFDKGGRKSGVMGTLGFGVVNADSGLTATGYTTPDVVDVHRNLAAMRDDGAEIVVMEVSSHGLSQSRVDAVAFDGAVFTNLTREHLDYHGSLEEYAKAKQLLFSSKGLKFAVLNRDDDYFRQFKEVINSGVDLVTYGVANHNSDFSVLATEYSASGIKALVKAPFGQVDIQTELLGEFNLSNLLAVISVASAMTDLSGLEERIGKIKPVSGRMEVVQFPEQPVAVVDYAHTPDALKNVLLSLRPLCEGKIRLIFGCGGDRDQGKRAEMAKIAELMADDIIVTDDNPRGEMPEAIIADIMSGFDDRSKVSVVHDRKLAIQEMLTQAANEDLILVAGKGHEEWQEIQGTRYHFSDVETIRELMCAPRSISGEAQEAMHD